MQKSTYRWQKLRTTTKQSSLNPQVHSLVSVNHSLNNHIQVSSPIEWSIVLVTSTSKHQVLKDIPGPWSLYTGSKAFHQMLWDNGASLLLHDSPPLTKLLNLPDLSPPPQTMVPALKIMVTSWDSYLDDGPHKIWSRALLWRPILNFIELSQLTTSLCTLHSSHKRESCVPLSEKTFHLHLPWW